MGKGKRLRSGGRRDRPEKPPDSVSGGSENPAAGCPVGDRCVGCGATEGLGRTFSMSVFGQACATTCRKCDGRSLLTMLGVAGLQERVAEHARH